MVLSYAPCNHYIQQSLRSLSRQTYVEDPLMTAQPEEESPDKDTCLVLLKKQFLCEHKNDYMEL